MSDQVENTEDRFSRDEAQSLYFNSSLSNDVHVYSQLHSPTPNPFIMLSVVCEKKFLLKVKNYLPPNTLKILNGLFQLT